MALGNASGYVGSRCRVLFFFSDKIHITDDIDYTLPWDIPPE